MNTRTNVRILVLSIGASAVVGATVILVARHASSASVPVCIKTNGQVRVLTAPAATYDASEQRSDWVVGGELTSIVVGQGLTGSRQHGTFQLAIDPSILQACTGCRGGRIFSGFNDGPVALPTGFDSEIARLDLPAGNFSIFVKMTVTNTRDKGFDDRAECTLEAGADFDQADLVLSEDVDPVVLHPYNAAAGLTYSSCITSVRRAA